MSSQIPENTPRGSVVAVANFSDADFGDHGLFNIQNTTSGILNISDYLPLSSQYSVLIYTVD